MTSLLNRVFDEIYVINLDRSTDRLKEVDSRLKRLGIKYQRISAVEGNKLSYAEIRKETTLPSALFSTKAAIGCALSHKKAWQDVVNRNLNRVLILEDDVVLAESNFEARFQKSWEAIPSDWEIVNLGCIAGCGDRDKYALFDWLISAPLLLQDSILGRSKTRGRLNELVTVPDVNCGSHAYAVTGSAARKMLAWLPVLPLPAHIDVLMSYRFGYRMKIYGITDATLFTQPLSSSQSCIATPGSPHFGNMFMDKFKVNNRGIPGGWCLSEPIIRLGSLQVSGWRILWMLLGFMLGLHRLPFFAIAMLADDVYFINSKHNVMQLTFDIFLFALGAFTRELVASRSN
jgi:GR25 family glycosyltransferase involved in LPS biosynthesis